MRDRQVFNPYLPLTEYIPDGEPHVFGDRVYVYGSHDEAGGDTYCVGPYVVYSAPLSDLSDWSTKGISYDVSKDPHHTKVRNQMYAPDVVCGKDGRYYMYYCLSGKAGKGGYDGPISVAVCDTPDGVFEYYGDVRNSDGSVYTRYVAFDPAVMNDDGVIRLYYGTMMPLEDHMNFFNRHILYKIQQNMYHRSMKELKENGGVMGAITVELSDDMLTIASEPKRIVPTRSKGTPWEGHSFFEASSIRKVGETYYFIYSSEKNHELCYATSRYPDRDFVYRGTIISNGDVGYQGRKDADRVNHTGNNHGSIVELNGQWYIFYHRMTHGTDYSRQACAESIQILPDGSIPQVEMTSCGLNGEPLGGKGTYPASICCNLTNGKMPHACNRKIKEEIPVVTEKDGISYVKNLTDNTWVGYKYFDFSDTEKVCITYRSRGAMKVGVAQCLNGEILAKEFLPESSEWTTQELPLKAWGKKSAFYLVFRGDGKADFKSMEFY